MTTAGKKLIFSKYSGCGNDFILVDNRNGLFPSENQGLIQRLCHRQLGIGSDGLILLENSSQADLSMRIFNSDGSEAEMCGNGVRCLVNFAKELGLHKDRYSIQTMKGKLSASVIGQKIAVDMGSPTEQHWHIPIKIDNHEHVVHHLDTGVPHLVWFCDSHDTVDLQRIGPLLRKQSAFAPRGANVNIATCKSNGEIHNRTYERGVEAETLACGTGCTAVALAAAKLKGLSSPITVHCRGGTLEISFAWRKGVFVDVALSGMASHLFSGQIDI
jgi:diaminopimelate epimerase